MAFGRIQAAYEVLSDTRKRAVYDEWAKDLTFRYVDGVASKVIPSISHVLASSGCQGLLA